MNNYRVRFKFDHENSQTLFLQGENEELLHVDIVAKKDWFTHTDDRGVFHAINLKLVTSITIVKYQR